MFDLRNAIDLLFLGCVIAVVVVGGAIVVDLPFADRVFFPLLMATIVVMGVDEVVNAAAVVDRLVGTLLIGGGLALVVAVETGWLPYGGWLAGAPFLVGVALRFASRDRVLDFLAFLGLVSR